MRLFGGWLDRTERLQREKYGNDLRGLVGDEYRGAVRTYVTAAIAELGEYLQETDWKPWKKIERNDPEQRDRRVEEIIDCLHFVANLLVLEGVDDAELSLKYLGKVSVNENRDDHTAERGTCRCGAMPGGPDPCACSAGTERARPPLRAYGIEDAHVGGGP